MNTQFKLLILCVFGFATLMSQADAKGNNSDRKKHKQRPSFVSLDADSSDSINFEEFSAHKIPFGDHQTIFDNIDSDNDGVITLEEYENHKPPQRKRREQ